jgi:RNAse (barnase) inhibitor barstar
VSNRVITIRGERVTTLESFYEEIGEAVNGPGGYFGANLDAVHDCLYGGFGVEPPFSVVWENSRVSREALGYGETVRELREMRSSCHPSNIEEVGGRLRQAERGEGPTVFHWITDVLSSVPNVKLELR